MRLRRLTSPCGWSLACWALALSGCDGETSEHWRPLVDHQAWTSLLAERAPLPDHRPDPVVCPRPYVEEGDAIEIDTGACNYVDLAQPLLRSIEVGDRLALDLWWATLASTEPASGHLALLVDGEVLWEEEVEIPGPADVRSLELESPLSAEAGHELVFHLHNHGYNNWSFGRLDVLEAGMNP